MPQQPPFPSEHPQQGQNPQSVQHPPQLPGLLRQDTLVMQQETSFMSNDFSVLDQNGRPLGYLETVGGGLSRAFLGSRHLRLTSAEGQPMVQIQDTLTFGRDRFEVSWPDGSPLAHVVKQIRFLSTAIEVGIVGGPVLNVAGDVFGHDFRYLAGDVQIGAVSRQWAGLGRGLMGHSRYALFFRSDVTPDRRLALIGTTVALDLIRAKQKSSG